VDCEGCHEKAAKEFAELGKVVDLYRRLRRLEEEIKVKELTHY
jgi:hypothetical protein